MEWLEVHIDTNHAGLEPLEIFLSANGVDGVVIDDEQDFQSFLENNHQYWDYVDEDLEASMKGKSRITFYLPADGDGFDQLAHLRTALQGFKDAHAGKYGTLLMVELCHLKQVQHRPGAPRLRVHAADHDLFHAALYNGSRTHLARL